MKEEWAGLDNTLTATKNILEMTHKLHRCQGYVQK